MSDEATTRVKGIIGQTTVAAATLGVILSPVPFADELVLVPVYGVMTVRIGLARGLALTAVPWRRIGAATAAGLAARAAINGYFAFIPGVAAVTSAASAAALTQLLGVVVDAVCRNTTAPPVVQAPAASATGAPA